MVIQGEFYQLIPVDESSLFFDLKLLHKVGGKNPREEFKDAGYGLTMLIASFTVMKVIKLSKKKL